jgi:branched-chain amino acid transport system ATP-binding protein
MSLLSMNSLTKRFGGLCAVNEVNFDIEPGEIVAIFGPNGSGKTTLLNLVSGLLPITSGTLLWKGASIGGASPHERSSLRISKTYCACAGWRTSADPRPGACPMATRRCSAWRWR